MLFPALLLLLSGTLAKEEFRIVQTRFGAVRGKRLDSYGGHSGFVFAGIPFARPPVGKLRFREAQDPEPWSGILDTFQYRNACMADPKKTFKTYEGNSIGPMSDDCMYLNLFTSRNCLDKGGCAVMVAYHGGNMKFESPILFKMDVIVNNFANNERNVIVVTVPYRLALSGWYHLTNAFKTSVDSNVGTKDALWSLQWLQREVRFFGGDPNRVTVYGHSAGAVITQHLAILPASDRLFHQVISQSGPADVSDFSRTVNIAASRAVTEVAGCATKGERYKDPVRVEAIIACMRNLTEDEFNESTLALNHMVEETAFTWIESDGIMPTYKKELLKRPRRLPLLIGATTAELRLARKVLDGEGRLNATRIDDLCTHVAYFTGYHRPEAFRSECLKYYNTSEMAQMFDDHLQFYKTVGDMADSFSSSGSPVFVYNYDYWGAGDAFVKYAKQKFEYAGPAHSEDFIYVLGTHRNESKMLPKDYAIERIYSGIVADFVNYGNPTPPGYSWKPWNAERRNHFKINFDKNLRMPGERDGYYLEVEKFWKTIVNDKVGDYTPLEAFPPLNDNSDTTNIISYILTAWTGLPEHIEKTMNASLAAFKLWDTWKNEKRQAFLATGVLEFRSDDVVISGAGLGWLTLSLVAIIAVLVGYIATVKVLDYRRRKRYLTLS